MAATAPEAPAAAESTTGDNKRIVVVPTSDTTNNKSGNSSLQSPIVDTPRKSNEKGGGDAFEFGSSSGDSQDDIGTVIRNFLPPPAAAAAIGGGGRSNGLTHASASPNFSSSTAAAQGVSGSVLGGSAFGGVATPTTLPTTLVGVAGDDTSPIGAPSSDSSNVRVIGSNSSATSASVTAAAAATPKDVFSSPSLLSAAQQQQVNGLINATNRSVTVPNTPPPAAAAALPSYPLPLLTGNNTPTLTKRAAGEGAWGNVNKGGSTDGAAGVSSPLTPARFDVIADADSGAASQSQSHLSLLADTIANVPSPLRSPSHQHQQEEAGGGATLHVQQNNPASGSSSVPVPLTPFAVNGSSPTGALRRQHSLAIPVSGASEASIIPNVLARAPTAINPSEPTTGPTSASTGGLTHSPAHTATGSVVPAAAAVPSGDPGRAVFPSPSGGSRDVREVDGIGGGAAEFFSARQTPTSPTDRTGVHQQPPTTLSEHGTAANYHNNNDNDSRRPPVPPIPSPIISTFGGRTSTPLSAVSAAPAGGCTAEGPPSSTTDRRGRPPPLPFAVTTHRQQQPTPMSSAPSSTVVAPLSAASATVTKSGGASLLPLGGPSHPIASIGIRRKTNGATPRTPLSPQQHRLLRGDAASAATPPYHSPLLPHATQQQQQQSPSSVASASPSAAGGAPVTGRPPPAVPAAAANGGDGGAAPRPSQWGKAKPPVSVFEALGIEQMSNGDAAPASSPSGGNRLTIANVTAKANATAAGGGGGGTLPAPLSTVRSMPRSGINDGFETDEESIEGTIAPFIQQNQQQQHQQQKQQAAAATAALSTPSASTTGTGAVTMSESEEEVTRVWSSATAVTTAGPSSSLPLSSNLHSPNGGRQLPRAVMPSVGTTSFGMGIGGGGSALVAPFSATPSAATNTASSATARNVPQHAVMSTSLVVKRVAPGTASSRTPRGDTTASSSHHRQQQRRADNGGAGAAVLSLEAAASHVMTYNPLFGMTEHSLLARSAQHSSPNSKRLAAGHSTQQATESAAAKIEDKNNTNNNLSIFELAEQIELESRVANNKGKSALSPPHPPPVTAGGKSVRPPLPPGGRRAPNAAAGGGVGLISKFTRKNGEDEDEAPASIIALAGEDMRASRRTTLTYFHQHNAGVAAAIALQQQHSGSLPSTSHSSTGSTMLSAPQSSISGGPPSGPRSIATTTSSSTNATNTSHLTTVSSTSGPREAQRGGGPLNAPSLGGGGSSNGGTATTNGSIRSSAPLAAAQNPADAAASPSDPLAVPSAANGGVGGDRLGVDGVLEVVVGGGGGGGNGVVYPPQLAHHQHHGGMAVGPNGGIVSVFDTAPSLSASMNQSQSLRVQQQQQQQRAMAMGIGAGGIGGAVFSSASPDRRHSLSPSIGSVLGTFSSAVSFNNMHRGGGGLPTSSVFHRGGGGVGATSPPKALQPHPQPSLSPRHTAFPAPPVVRAAPLIAASVASVGGGGHHFGIGATPYLTASSALRAAQPWRWTPVRKLGKGSFGEVFLGNAVNTVTGAEELVANKKIDLRRYPLDKRAAAARTIRREINIMKGLHHPNVVRYLRSKATDLHINVFMEYVPSGSLRSLLDGGATFEPRTVARYARLMLEGLAYCHSNGIVHRDIKAANVLLALDGQVKIADFGSAHAVGAAEGVAGTLNWMAPEVLRGPPAASNSEPATSSVGGAATRGGGVGDANEGSRRSAGDWSRSVSPSNNNNSNRKGQQNRHHQHITDRVDVWSLGCTLMELMTGGAFPFVTEALDAAIAREQRRAAEEEASGFSPFSFIKRQFGRGGASAAESAAAIARRMRNTPMTHQDLQAMLVIYLREEVADPVPIAPAIADPLARDFLAHCLRVDPAERPSAAMLLQHPFITEYNYLGNGHNQQQQQQHEQPLYDDPHFVNGGVSGNGGVGGGREQQHHHHDDTNSLDTTVLSVCASQPHLPLPPPAAALLSASHSPQQQQQIPLAPVSNQRSGGVGVGVGGASSVATLSLQPPHPNHLTASAGPMAMALGAFGEGGGGGGRDTRMSLMSVAQSTATIAQSVKFGHGDDEVDRHLGLVRRQLIALADDPLANVLPAPIVSGGGGGAGPSAPPSPSGPLGVLPRTPSSFGHRGVGMAHALSGSHHPSLVSRPGVHVSMASGLGHSTFAGAFGTAQSPPALAAMRGELPLAASQLHLSQPDLVPHHDALVTADNSDVGTADKAVVAVPHSQNPLQHPGLAVNIPLSGTNMTIGSSGNNISGIPPLAPAAASASLHTTTPQTSPAASANSGLRIAGQQSPPANHSKQQSPAAKAVSAAGSAGSLVTPPPAAVSSGTTIATNSSGASAGLLAVPPPAAASSGTTIATTSSGASAGAFPLASEAGVIIGAGGGIPSAAGTQTSLSVNAPIDGSGLFGTVFVVPHHPLMGSSNTVTTGLANSNNSLSVAQPRPPHEQQEQEEQQQQQQHVPQAPAAAVSHVAFPTPFDAGVVGSLQSFGVGGGGGAAGGGLGGGGPFGGGGGGGPAIPPRGPSPTMTEDTLQTRDTMNDYGRGGGALLNPSAFRDPEMEEIMARLNTMHHRARFIIRVSDDQQTRRGGGVSGGWGMGDSSSPSPAAVGGTAGSSGPLLALGSSSSNTNSGNATTLFVGNHNNIAGGSNSGDGGAVLAYSGGSFSTATAPTSGSSPSPPASGIANKNSRPFPPPNRRNSSANPLMPPSTSNNPTPSPAAMPTAESVMVNALFNGGPINRGGGGGGKAAIIGEANATATTTNNAQRGIGKEKELGASSSAAAAAFAGPLQFLGAAGGGVAADGGPLPPSDDKEPRDSLEVTTELGEDFVNVAPPPPRRASNNGLHTNKNFLSTSGGKGGVGGGVGASPHNNQQQQQQRGPGGGTGHMGVAALRSADEGAENANIADLLLGDLSSNDPNNNNNNNNSGGGAAILRRGGGGAAAPTAASLSPAALRGMGGGNAAAAAPAISVTISLLETVVGDDDGEGGGGVAVPYYDVEIGRDDWASDVDLSDAEDDDASLFSEEEGEGEDGAEGGAADAAGRDGRGGGGNFAAFMSRYGGAEGTAFANVNGQYVFADGRGGHADGAPLRLDSVRRVAAARRRQHNAELLRNQKQRNGGGALSPLRCLARALCCFSSSTSSSAAAHPVVDGGSGSGSADSRTRRAHSHSRDTIGSGTIGSGGHGLVGFAPRLAVINEEAEGGGGLGTLPYGGVGSSQQPMLLSNSTIAFLSRDVSGGTAPFLSAEANGGGGDILDSPTAPSRSVAAAAATELASSSDARSTSTRAFGGDGSAHRDRGAAIPPPASVARGDAATVRLADGSGEPFEEGGGGVVTPSSQANASSLFAFTLPAPQRAAAGPGGGGAQKRGAFGRRWAVHVAIVFVVVLIVGGAIAGLVIGLL